VVLTSAFGATTSSPAALTLTFTNTMPFILQQPQSFIVVTGQTAVFSVNARPCDLAYQWYFNETNALADQTNTVLTLANVQLDEIGIYSVVITNETGAITSDLAQLILNTAPAAGNDGCAITVNMQAALRVAKLLANDSDPNNDPIFYLFDWGDGSTSGWLGPFTSGSTGVGTHTWDELGTYSVKVKARDIWGAASSWSDPLVVTITDNNLPSIPEITGPAEGKPGKPYLFNFVSEDLDEHTIYYYVDWGDNTTTEWVGPYVSGMQIHLTHTWDTKGTYAVKAKARDSMGAESDWGTFSVVMPMDYRFSFSAFLQHLLELFPRGFPILRHLMGF